MKTILERAKEAVIDPFDPDEMLPVRMGYLSMLERRGFVAGAMSELNELLRWHKIQSDKSGFATDEALDEIFRELPRLVKDKRDGCIELIDYDNAAELLTCIVYQPYMPIEIQPRYKTPIFDHLCSPLARF